MQKYVNIYKHRHAPEVSTQSYTDTPSVWACTQPHNPIYVWKKENKNSGFFFLKN